ncbi:alpha/beta hydrolase family protein [Nocardiopsis lambiniae]|uniref:alpha/beta hydrolase family protein n=1 Tax=Nocardiopsis lambiniae TaxID=3075539 RepID=UPI0037C600BD
MRRRTRTSRPNTSARTGSNTSTDPRPPGPARSPTLPVGVEQDGLLDAVDRAVGQGCTDPDRVGIHRSSYGGYAALVGAAFTPDRFAAAVGYTGRSGPVDPTEGIVPFARSSLVNHYLRYFGGRSSTTS